MECRNEQPVGGYGDRLGQRPKSDQLAPRALALIEVGRSYRPIGCELGLRKNTVADIAKRYRGPEIQGEDTMTRRLQQPPTDPHRKARFREEARDIVAKDRRDRKYGYAVDTAGAIARSLERAYKEGFADAQGSNPVASPIDSEDGPINWALIPPRPRAAFWSCCLFIFGRKGDQSRPGRLEPAETERGTVGWRLVVDGFNNLKVIGGKSIQPLVRLGLLRSDPLAAHQLIITEKGQATWQLFLDRGGEFSEDLTSF